MKICGLRSRQLVHGVEERIYWVLLGFQGVKTIIASLVRFQLAILASSLATINHFFAVFNFKVKLL